MGKIRTISCTLFSLDADVMSGVTHIDVMYVDHCTICFVMTKEFFTAIKRDNVQKS